MIPTSHASIRMNPNTLVPPKTGNSCLVGKITGPGDCFIEHTSADDLVLCLAPSFSLGGATMKKRHPDYTLADQAHGVCPYCLAPVEVDCDCEKERDE